MFTSNGYSCHLIAIEGPDRVGKATQAKMLEAALNERKIKATVEEIPYDEGVTHPEIYRMLKDGTVNQEPVVFQTLQGINRRYFQTKFLPNLASHFDVVVLDRWNLSTYVYGKASGVVEATTAAILKGVVEPDVTLVFDAPPFPKEGLDVWEADNVFQKRVREGYRDWCERDPKQFVKIDAGRPKDEVHQSVLEVVLPRLR